MCEICPEIKHRGRSQRSRHRGPRVAAAGTATGSRCSTLRPSNPSTMPRASLVLPDTALTRDSPGCLCAGRGTRAAARCCAGDCRLRGRHGVGTAASLRPIPTRPQQWGWATHHPHLGEVHQAVLGVVWGALLDERQVGQVHSQVGDTRRVTTLGANQEHVRKKTTIPWGSAGRDSTASRI